MTPISEALCLTDLSSSPDLAGCVTLGEALCLWAAPSPHWHGRGTSHCGVLGSGGRTPAEAPGLLLHPPAPSVSLPPVGGHQPCVEGPQGRENKGQRRTQPGAEGWGSEKAVKWAQK